MLHRHFQVLGHVHTHTHTQRIIVSGGETSSVACDSRRALSTRDNAVLSCWLIGVAALTFRVRRRAEDVDNAIVLFAE